MTPTRSSPTRRMVARLCALALLTATASCAATNGDQVPRSAEDGSGSTVTASSPAPATTTDDEMVPSDAVGDEDVQTTEQLPMAEIDWAVHQLELPAAVGPDVWLSHVSVSNAGLVAIGFAWDISRPVQTVISWTSVDGDLWDRRELPLEPGVTMHQAVSLNGIVYALGQQTNADEVEPLVWSMDDGGGWDSIDLSSSGTDLSGVTILSATSNVNGIVLGAERSLAELRRTVSFDTGGVRFELNDRTGTYELTNIESGRVVSTGESADIFGWNNEGQAVYDLTTGELLAVVPREVWEQPDRAVSPLPIPVPAEAAIQSISIEWDGLRIIIDEADNSYEVADAESGVVVSSGALPDLFRGPAPVFVDNESGEVALKLSWDEWDMLMNDAYQQADGAEVPRTAEQLVLHSSDGKDWVEVSLADEADTQFDSLFALGNEFIAATVAHGEFESTRSFYTSMNGTDWEFVERRPLEEVVTVDANDNDVIGLSYEEESLALMMSTDGRSWATALQMAGRDDGGSVWLQFAAIGGAGTAAIATINPSAAAEVLTITVDSQTATFGAAGSVVEITEDRTGETLLEVTEDDVETGDADFATYGDGATRFWSPSGELVMTISDADAFAAFNAQAGAYDDAVHQVIFIETDGQWFEAGLPELDDGFVAQLAVGDDVIVVGAINGDGFDGQVAPADTITVLVGTAS
jgi:hypothetical protein